VAFIVFWSGKRPSEIVPVVVLDNINVTAARERCLIDIFISSCLSLRNAESVFHIITLLPENLKQKLIATHIGTGSLAKLIGVDRETIRLWKQKHKSKIP